MGHISDEHYRNLSEKFSSKKEGFVARAKSVHGDVYNYDKVVYVNNKTKVIITCSKHGDFEQRPDNHTNLKHCCPKCKSDKQSVRQLRSTEEIVFDFKKVHGDRFDYSKVDYVDYNIDVTIVCKKHGEFKQKANDHLSGRSCKKCYDERRKKLSDDLNKISRKTRCLIKSRFREKGYTKKSKSFEILGCTWEEFKNHLEANEFGFKISDPDLDLDHIIPVSTAKSEEDILRLNHYSNFQLLPADYNRNVKRDKPFDKECFKKYLKTNKIN